jgi:putative ABC transport system permease protein
MGSLETLRLALAGLAARRGRSTLTILSITIGAFAIVVMSALASSGLRTMERGIEELGGARIVMVVPKVPERAEDKQAAYRRGFTLADRDRYVAGIPHVAGVTLFTRLGKKEVQAESGLRATTSVVAADARFFDVFRMKVARGHAFTDEEDRGRAPTCVVGHKLAEKIGPAPSEPLGRLLSVGGLRCRIEGVFADNDRFGVGFGFDWTDLVVVPGESMSDVDPRAVERATLFVQTDAPAANDLVKRIVNARLSARHPGVDDFTLFDFSHMMESFRFVFAAMELVVAVLAGISLFVGGVGVMNMMLVAVSERTVEIGIRKALGASPRAIGAQFLAESTLLATLGGGIGVAAGLGTAALASTLIARSIKSWQPDFAPWAAAGALGVAVGLGILFGWLPAKRAAALDPIEAIRR